MFLYIHIIDYQSLYFVQCAYSYLYSSGRIVRDIVFNFYTLVTQLSTSRLYGVETPIGDAKVNSKNVGNG
jgi:hypothetical protein